MKLYRVTIEVEAFVVAETEKEACELASDFVEDVYLPDCADAVEAREYPKGSGKVVMPAGWDDKCLVYGTDKDMTVAEAVQKYVLPQEPAKPLVDKAPGCDGEDMMPVEAPADGG